VWVRNKRAVLPALLIALSAFGADAGSADTRVPVEARSVVQTFARDLRGVARLFVRGERSGRNGPAWFCVEATDVRVRGTVKTALRQKGCVADIATFEVDPVTPEASAAGSIPTKLTTKTWNRVNGHWRVAGVTTTSHAAVVNLHWSGGTPVPAAYAPLPVCLLYGPPYVFPCVPDVNPLDPVGIRLEWVARVTGTISLRGLGVTARSGWRDGYVQWSLP
jgi:hypothetical protein